MKVGYAIISTMCKRIAALMLTALVMLPAWAAIPAAGVQIENTASGHYFFNGEKLPIISNTVQANVNEVRSLVLTEDQTVERSPGGNAVFVHILQNAGNVAERVQLGLAQLGVDDYDFSSIELWIDEDGDGFPTSQDTLVTGDDFYTLPMGEQLRLLVRVYVPGPAQVSTGESGQVRLTAMSETGTTLTNTDTVVVRKSVSFSIRKFASAVAVSAGDEIEYEIELINDSGVDARPIEIQVDGIARDVVLLRDEIPANTTFERLIDTQNQDFGNVGGISDPANTNATLAGHQYVLYQVVGAASDVYTATQPVDKDSIAQVAYSFVGVMPAGRVMRLTFAVTTNENASGIVYNTGIVEAADENDQPLQQQSAEVQTQVNGAPATIDNFNDDYSELQPVINAGDGLYIQLDAPGCNANRSQQDPVAPAVYQAQVVSETGDAVIVDLLETANNSGLFRPVDYSTNPETFPFAILTELQTSSTIIDSTDDVLVVSSSETLRVTALADCAGDAESEVRVVEVLNVVYDTSTLLPVPGAIVTLVDLDGVGAAAGYSTCGAAPVSGQPAQPACVFSPTDAGKPVGDPSATPITDGGRTTSDANGEFSFPAVLPGRYLYLVTTPAGLTYTSVVPPSNLPEFWDLDLAFGNTPVGMSYGGEYVLESDKNNEPVISFGDFFDIPLDPQETAPQLLVQKQVSPSDARLGDSVEYTVEVQNATGQPLTNISVLDVLPQGFFYIRGTSKFNGEPVADPVFDQDGGLLYEFNFCAPGEDPCDPPKYPTFTDTPGTVDSHKITYRVRIGVGALDGDRTNRVNAITIIERPDPLEDITYSGNASAVVGLLTEVFSDEGYIVGKVYMECSFDRTQGHEEIGIPGIRIYMEDGSYAVTDAEGQYSFYGIRAGTHVLKVDEETLPVGAEMKPLYNRHAGVGTSQFVDLKQGDIARADFAEGGCTKEMERQVKQRRSRGEVFVSEVERGLTQELRIEGFRPVADPKRRGASGLIGGEKSADLARLVGSAGLQLDAALSSGVQSNSGSVLERVLLTEAEIEELANTADPEIGFINVFDGAVLPSDSWNVQIKGGARTPIKLLVNGVAVDDRRIGQSAVNKSRNVAVAEYIAVKLQPGTNVLSAAVFDPFGNQRDTVDVTVTVPGKIEGLKFGSPQDLEADGVTKVPFYVTIEDEFGNPRPSYMPITIVASEKVRWLVEDLDPEEPGLQVFMQGVPTAELAFYGPQTATTVKFDVTAGGVSDSHEIEFVPPLRKMVAVGFVEGMLSMNDFDGGAVKPAGQHDGFERELQAWSWTNEDGSKYAGAKAKFFLKGKVLGKYLLTASFDSDKDEEERLFRDIRPDEFYPVYGDSSVRGFEAQSTSRLYVRLDRGKSWIQWGDATSGGNTGVTSLASYSRSMTGVKGHLDLGDTQIDAYVSNESSSRVVQEFEADSGFEYKLPNSDLIPNSEQIEIVQRNRQQLSVVENTIQLTRFVDYTVNYETGRLVFLEPISGATIYQPDQNAVNSGIEVRQYIRVVYEVERGGPRNLLAGAAVTSQLTENIKVGAEYAHDEDPDLQLQAASVGAEVKLGKSTTLKLEYARTRKLNTEFLNDPTLPEKVEGDAMSADISHRGEGWDARVFLKEADGEFGTSTGSVSSGSTEGKADFSVKLGDKTNLRTDAGFTRTNSGDTERRWGNVSVQRRIGEKFNISLGGGYNRNDTTTIDQNTQQPVTEVTEDKTVDLKIDSPLPWLEDGSAFVEYRKDIKDNGQQSIAVGGEYQFTSRTKISLRHEIENSLDARGAGTSDAAQRTQLELAAGFGESGEVFGGFTDRLRSGANGRDLNAKIGLRQKWSIGSDYNVDLSAEHSRKIIGEGESNDQYTATLSGEYVGDPLWKASARLEGRYSKKQWSLYNTIGVGRKLSRDWVLLTKNAFEFINNTDTNSIAVSDRFQLGFAYRDTDRNKWQALLRYELELARDEGQDQRKLAHVVSGHLNYQISENMHLSGRVAVKRVNEKIGNDRFNYVAHLLGMRWGWDFAERWDAGFIMSYMRDRHAQNYGAGLEVGYLLYANLWLSAGYNFWGYEDTEFSGNDYTNPGAYLKFRYKFDETLFDRRDAGVNNSIIPPRD